LLVGHLHGACFHLRCGNHQTEQAPHFNLIVLCLGPRMSSAKNLTPRRRVNPLGKLPGALRMTRNTETKDNGRPPSGALTK
jgi:hypothetical protein